ncbi:hypothetical protein Hamer_G020592, partial [Homarus americanus]
LSDHTILAPCPIFYLCIRLATGVYLIPGVQQTTERPGTFALHSCRCLVVTVGKRRIADNAVEDSGGWLSAVEDNGGWQTVQRRMADSAVEG